jgi:hypothetical protein
MCPSVESPGAKTLPNELQMDLAPRLALSSRYKSHRSTHRSMPPARPLPRWFTPARLLCIFCFTNLMVYLDRGVRRAMRTLARPPARCPRAPPPHSPHLQG